MQNLQPQLVLASASPRRAELLRMIGLQFVVDPAGIDETQLPSETPADYVIRLACAKAELVAHKHQLPIPVLGADTTVVCDGEILGKPSSDAESVAMLKRLAGRTHEVLTAVALAQDDRVSHQLARALVRFRDLSRTEIATYIASGEGRDKAGGYGIQGIGGIFVAHIEGSYSAIVGLPLLETEQLLRAFGVATWRNRGA